MHSVLWSRAIIVVVINFLDWPNARRIAVASRPWPPWWLSITILLRHFPMLLWQDFLTIQPIFILNFIVHFILIILRHYTGYTMTYSGYTIPLWRLEVLRLMTRRTSLMLRAFLHGTAIVRNAVRHMEPACVKPLVLIAATKLEDVPVTWFTRRRCNTDVIILIGDLFSSHLLILIPTIPQLREFGQMTLMPAMMLIAYLLSPLKIFNWEGQIFIIAYTVLQRRLSRCQELL